MRRMLTLAAAAAITAITVMTGASASAAEAGLPDQVVVMPLPAEHFEFGDAETVESLDVTPGQVLDVVWKDQDSECMPRARMCAEVQGKWIDPGSALFTPAGTDGTGNNYPSFYGLHQIRGDLGPGFMTVYANDPREGENPGVTPDGVFWVSDETLEHKGETLTRVAWDTREAWLETRVIEPVEIEVDEVDEPDEFDETPSESIPVDDQDPSTDGEAATPPENESPLSDSDSTSRWLAAAALLGAGVIAGIGLLARRRERMQITEQGVPEDGDG